MKFKEGQIVMHKISKEKFVVIKHSLYHSITHFRNVILCSQGKYNSDQFIFMENELRVLTPKEIKDDELQGLDAVGGKNGN